MVLKRKFALGHINEVEMKELVLHQVDYVRNFIYKFRNRDRAHYEWMYEKIPWLKQKINREEIKLLDRMIMDY